MAVRRIGIIMNGVTGRMGTNQHLVRSILAIIKQGGVQISDNLRLMPDPILTGRNTEKLKALAEAHGPAVIGKPLKYTTDLASALGDKNYSIFFDASGTLQRAQFVELGLEAGFLVALPRRFQGIAKRKRDLAAALLQQDQILDRGLGGLDLGLHVRNLVAVDFSDGDAERVIDAGGAAGQHIDEPLCHGRWRRQDENGSGRKRGQS